MGNCLITKLKGSVSADLPKFNQMILHVTRNENYEDGDETLSKIRCVHFDTNGPISLQVVGSEGYYSLKKNDYETRLTEGTYEAGSITFAFANKTFDVILTGMYNITAIVSMNVGNEMSINNLVRYDANLIGYNPLTRMVVLKSLIDFDIKNIANMPDLSFLSAAGCENIVGDIGVLIGRTFDLFSLENTNVSGTLEQLMQVQGYTGDSINVQRLPKVGGNISALAQRTTLTSFTATNNKSIFGNINSLGVLRNLKNFSLAGCTENSFTGSIEEFVSIQINAGAGRTEVPYSDPMSAYWLVKYAKFGGQYWNQTGMGFLTWKYDTSGSTPRTKIAFYGGGITGGIANTTKVYCSGYTAEEVAAETTFAGKNPTRVDA